MQSSALTYEELTHRYTTAIDAVCDIAREYYTIGRSGDAQHLLSTALQLLEASEAMPQHRLKLLLLSGQVLIVDHLLTSGDADLLLLSML
jgi:hypothetical protein